MNADHRPYFIGAAIGIACVSVGAALEHSAAANQAVGVLVTHAVTEIGIALFISVILALSFERISRAKFEQLASNQQTQLATQMQALSLNQITTVADQIADRFRSQLSGFTIEFADLAAKTRDEINKDIFRHVIGHSVPESIRVEFDEQILRNHFFFRGFTMSVVMRPCPFIIASVEQYYMLLEVRLHYEVENLTSHEQAYDPTPRVLKLCPPEIASQIKFLRLNLKGPHCDLSLGESSLSQIRTEDEFSVRSHVEPILIPPKSEQSVTTVDVTYQTVTSYQHGYYLHVLPQHTYQVDVSVDAKDALVSVIAQDLTGNPLRESHLGNPARHLFAWTSTRPFLASQGFYIAWGSKR
jgi:hypothetical protein